MRFRPEGLTANAWAVKAGVSRNFWNDLKRHGNPSRRTLEKLLAAAGSSLAEFEALRIDRPIAVQGAGPAGLGEQGRAWRPAPLAPLPLVATSAAGWWGKPDRQIELLRIARNEIVDQLPRPASLATDPEAYAVTMIGNSMWPRFRSGRRLAISPGSSAQVGDDVLVVLPSSADEDEQVLVKELVGRSADGIQLRQFNPDFTFQVDGAEVLALHKIAGELF